MVIIRRYLIIFIIVNTIIKLGKLSDTQVMQWRNLLKAIKNPECFLTSLRTIFVNDGVTFLVIEGFSISTELS
jgi:hypothetical protein